MDDQNSSKVKINESNIAYSPPITGNEIALRVALCDLVQRLKRSEFMCKYLEQCRNELANEVIRLRSHNEQIVKEFSSHSNERIVSSPHHLLHPAFGSPIQDLRTIGLLKNGGSTTKLDSFTDESWEEISNRLINELKQEIMNAELLEQQGEEEEGDEEREEEEEERQEEEFVADQEGRLSNSSNEQQTSESPYFKPITNQYPGDNNKHKYQLLQPKTQLNSTSESNTSEREFDPSSSQQMITNDCSKSALHEEAYETQERHMAIIDSPNKSGHSRSSNDQPTGNSSTNLDLKLISKSDFKLLGLGNELLKVIEIHKENSEQRKFDLSSILYSFNDRTNRQHSGNISTETGINTVAVDRDDAFELVEKVLHNYNVDLEEITKQVLLQNERLLKLKGKQLRNFFRRQLDQSSGQEGNSGQS